MRILQINFWLFFVALCISAQAAAQEIDQYAVFAGRYDYTAIGNTLNLVENGGTSPCEILTESSASLSLSQEQTVIAAYLYWAGSGTGDFDVLLNDIPITAERTFASSIDANRVFFAAFADVTNQITSTGSGLYTLSELDLTDVIGSYCATGTNFGGWAITVIYEEETLPLNQVNVFDGLQSVSAIQNDLSIVLNNLNVLDNDNAKIGFVAWEGDAGLAVEETLSINGNTLSNPPLNPSNNQFNGTHSFTGQNDLYNMDIDFYNIENNINVGDTQAVISLTSGQDFVMINSIITVLNSQLPDAIIALEDAQSSCTARQVTTTTVIENIGTVPLPSGTPIAFYADAIGVGNGFTDIDIDPQEFIVREFDIVIPNNLPAAFTLRAVIDDDGSGVGVVAESNESNNISTSIMVELDETLSSELFALSDLIACNEGFETATFNLQEVEEEIALQSGQEVTGFFLEEDDAISVTNTILDPANYVNISSPQTIYVRLDDTLGEECFELLQFNLLIENCPPFVPEGFSPNGDTINDQFEISGLKDIFDYTLLIYSRLGNLVYEGDNQVQFWDGTPNVGFLGTEVPTGVYFYILHLNDPIVPDMSGWVYLNR